MKKVLLLLLLVILANATAAQEKDPAVKIGEKFTLHSNVLTKSGRIGPTIFSHLGGKSFALHDY